MNFDQTPMFRSKNFVYQRYKVLQYNKIGEITRFLKLFNKSFVNFE